MAPYTVQDTLRRMNDDLQVLCPNKLGVIGTRGSELYRNLELQIMWTHRS